VVTRILDGEVDLIVNTPFGAGSSASAAVRLDGYEIRTAAVRRGVPCVTTVAGLAAAVQGIEATIRGEIGVRSLQEHALGLRGAPDGKERHLIGRAPQPYLPGGRPPGPPAAGLRPAEGVREEEAGAGDGRRGPAE
jgi:hypothetical protein